MASFVGQIIGSKSNLQALWELVPTERQRRYKAIYDRTLHDEGASESDALELNQVTQLLDRYERRGLVPVGSYRVPTPAQIQAAAADDTGLVRPEIEAETIPSRPPAALLLLGLGCLLVFGFLFVRNLGSRPTS